MITSIHNLYQAIKNTDPAIIPEISPAIFQIYEKHSKNFSQIIDKKQSLKLKSQVQALNSINAAIQDVKKQSSFHKLSSLILLIISAGLLSSGLFFYIMTPQKSVSGLLLILGMAVLISNIAALGMNQIFHYAPINFCLKNTMPSTMPLFCQIEYVLSAFKGPKDLETNFDKSIREIAYTISQLRLLLNDKKNLTQNLEKALQSVHLEDVQAPVDIHAVQSLRSALLELNKTDLLLKQIDKTTLSQQLF